MHLGLHCLLRTVCRNTFFKYNKKKKKFQVLQKTPCLDIFSCIIAEFVFYCLLQCNCKPFFFLFFYLCKISKIVNTLSNINASLAKGLNSCYKFPLPHCTVQSHCLHVKFSCKDEHIFDI